MKGTLGLVGVTTSGALQGAPQAGQFYIIAKRSGVGGGERSRQWATFQAFDKQRQVDICSASFPSA